VKELEYRLIKELCAITHDRIAVRFAYERHDAVGPATNQSCEPIWICDHEDPPCWVENVVESLSPALGPVYVVSDVFLAGQNGLP
jgi:hypothetical protein